MATGRKRWRSKGALRSEHLSERAGIGTHAAELEISPERVLLEIMRVAFSDLSRVAHWQTGEDGLQVKKSSELDPADAAAIAEIVASAATGRIYRIKMHEKTPGLLLVARCLGMLAKPATVPNDSEPTEDEASVARKHLIAALDRLATEATTGSGDSGDRR